LFVKLSFTKLIQNKDSSLLSILQNYMSSYFNNSQSTALSEILNNRSLAFKINKESSGLSTLIINTSLVQTLLYKKVTLSLVNLKCIFKELIIKSNEILIKDLFLNISSDLYKDITLEKFAQFENMDNTDPYKCFREFNPNVEETNFFMYN